MPPEGRLPRLEGQVGAPAAPPGAALAAGAAGRWLAIALLAALYFAAGKLGLQLAFVNPSATAVWPPTGIALAALLVLGPGAWPGVFLGAFLVNLTTAGSTATSLAIAAGNTLEALLGARLVTRFANGREAFHGAGDLLRFAVLAAGLSTVASATIGVGALTAGGLSPARDLGRVWLVWWLGDAVGAILVAPLLVLWLSAPRPLWDRRRAAEALLLIGATFLVGQAAFGGWLPAPLKDAPLDFLTAPLLLWAAFRFGPRETAIACALLSALALRGTVAGFGPFAGRPPDEALLLLQAFLAMTTLTGLALAALVAQNRRAAAALREANAALELRDARRGAALSRSEEALRLQAEELARVNAELAQFAGVAAHELQEPLRKILTFGRLLKDSGQALSREVRDYVDRMEGAAGRMQKLVDDILSLSRVTTNASPLEAVALGEVVGEVARDFEGRLASAGGALEAEDLPTVRADAGQMRRLFENLVSNAYKFRRREEGLRIVISRREAPSGFVSVQVADNGIGFDEKYRERIFKPFERLNRKSDYEGSGMGLAICRRILLRHGGDITASSEPGKGSVFTVTLPKNGGDP